MKYLNEPIKPQSSRNVASYQLSMLIQSTEYCLNYSCVLGTLIQDYIRICIQIASEPLEIAFPAQAQIVTGYCWGTSQLECWHWHCHCLSRQPHVTVSSKEIKCVRRYYTKKKLTVLGEHLSLIRNVPQQMPKAVWGRAEARSH